MWLKDIAPSAELRKWFGHKPERFTEFTARDETELNANAALAQPQGILAEHKQVTLLYSAHDTANNQAQVLLRYFSHR